MQADTALIKIKTAQNNFQQTSSILEETDGSRTFRGKCFIKEPSPQ